MFQILGGFNLEQTLGTLGVLGGVLASYRPILKKIQSKFGLQFTTTGMEMQKFRMNKLFNELTDIYDTTLVGKPVDTQIIELEETKYAEYKRLGGNGLIDRRREMWLKNVVKRLDDKTTKVVK